MPSSRESEATEAIHKNAKVDSSMDRHADKSARDDRETSNDRILSTPQDSRIFDEKAGLCSGEQGDKTRASIDAASHKLPALSQKAKSSKPKRQRQTRIKYGNKYRSIKE